MSLISKTTRRVPANAWPFPDHDSERVACNCLILRLRLSDDITAQESTIAFVDLCVRGMTTVRPQPSISRRNPTSNECCN